MEYSLAHKRKDPYRTWDEFQNNYADKKNSDQENVQSVWYNLYKILEKATYSIAIESRLVLAWGWGRFREMQEEKITKKQKKTFGDDS